MCKDNSVQYVKTITSQPGLACSRHRLGMAIKYAMDTKKGLGKSSEVYIIIFTHRDPHSRIWSMPGKAAKKSKREALKRHGTLNPHPHALTDPLFETGDFFDRDDIVQVKYEMLRRVTVDKQSVTQSATAFGFSRPTYYQAGADFQRDGLFGLLPEKRGPRQGHKLTPDVLDFAMDLRASDPSLRPPDLAAAIQERFAVNAHPRSIERALTRQEKKRR